MYEFLDSIGLFGVIIFFVILIIGSIYVLRLFFDQLSKKVLRNEIAVKAGSRKYFGLSMRRYHYLFFNISLAISLGIVLVLLEFPSFNKETLSNLGDLELEDEKTLDIPPTTHAPPPPPKIEVINIVEVDDGETIEEELPDIIQEFDEESAVAEVQARPAQPEEVVEEVEEEEVDEIFTFVEEPSEPIGGMAAFYKYVSDNLKYPEIAKGLALEGRVIVQFVIEKNGSLSNIEVLRGIGGGCDEEAVRVIRKAPAWKPAKQRGRPVKQRKVIPIIFKLN